jgi:predicted nucleotidyltransferase
VASRDSLAKTLQYGYERYRLLKRWREIARKVAEKIRERFPDAEVYVFGSVVEERYTAASDIDILVVTKHAPKRLRDKVDIILWLEDGLGLPPSLLDLHIVAPGSEDYEWFFKALRIKAIKVE